MTKEIKFDFQEFEKQRQLLLKYSVDQGAFEGVVKFLDLISDAYLLSGGKPVVLNPTHQYPNDDTPQIDHIHTYRCIPLMGEQWDCSKYIRAVERRSIVLQE